jgi:choline dehydrogenase-like flavoprotein
VNRRDLIRRSFAFAAWMAGRRTIARASSVPDAPRSASARAAGSFGSGQAAAAPRAASQEFSPEYIVVGSGAGGGTVAARLAESGFRVLLLEAGGDPRKLEGGDPQSSGRNALPEDYDVPAFHSLATENEALRWDFFVRHYKNDARQRLDPKYRERVGERTADGILYPRAGTLGGCTAHNAMIFVYPHNSDWNQIADLTGDDSWRADRMRAYFEKIEDCRHRWFERFLSRLGLNPSRHGWGGWLPTEVAIPEAALEDRDLRNTIIESAKGALEAVGGPFGNLARIESQEDPNDWRVVSDSAIGIRYAPMTTDNHGRVGTRERLLDVQARFPGRLKIELNALATRVLFDESRRAIGVEYLNGERLYGAHAKPKTTAGERREARASREVILAGGAFNTPQLLMLSGIGPRTELAAHNIPVLVDLPVGRNLQDRYEVAVVHRMTFDAWKPLRGANFNRDDAQFREWSRDREGVFTTNGVVLSVIARSSNEQPEPDLFCYGLIGDFQGYFPGYSTLVAKNPNCFTWVVLKGHTNNTAGTVTLRSANPLDPPVINFNYFDEGNDARKQDVKAVVEGVKLARTMAGVLKRLGLAKEELPGDAALTDDAIAEWVKNNAWGHHASCTCPIGPQDRGGVLSGDFKVYGTQALRVVDASIFPRVPGLFIVSAVFMIGEKAAEVIAADAKRA